MGSGIRECVIARDGWALTSVDYPAEEMITLAQVLFDRYGPNSMQAAINRGDDLHCRLVATMLDRPYEEIVKLKKTDPYIKNVRQAAKAGNFGFAGGMGPVKFVISKRKDKSDEFPNGIRFCELLGRQKKCGDTPYEIEFKGNKYSPFCPVCVECAVEIREAYLRAWPEMVQFFRDCSAETSGPEGGWLEIPGTNKTWVRTGPGHRDGHWVACKPVVRGPLPYTAYANGHFQGLAAVASKLALWRVTEESYAVPSSPLYKVCRPVAFIHDEILSEIWIPNLHDAAWRIVHLMKEAIEEVCPDVKALGMEPAASRRWYKNAEAVYDREGRLTCWEPGVKYVKGSDGRLYVPTEQAA